MSITYHVGDTREVVATIPDGSVSLVACSPPFIALRSYLPANHPMKSAEIGSEPDPATFLDTLLALTAEWGRVLAQWGSIAIELGDTFASSGSGNENNLYTSGYSGGRQYETQKPPGAVGTRGQDNWPRPKCLALVPQAYALSLAYGRNILTGAESPAGQWLVRNVVVWHRPNPAVGALGDKFRPSTSYIVVATRSAQRWFDLTAVRTAHKYPDRIDKPVYVKGQTEMSMMQSSGNIMNRGNAAGAPPLDAWFDVCDAESARFDQHDTWTITTQPSSLAHYAMWPPKLAERLILSMCPAEVCSVCGEPRRRVEKIDGLVDNKGRPVERVNWPSGMDHVDPETGKRRHMVDGVMGGALGATSLKKTGGTTTTTTLGWTDCGHDAFIPGTVLDPFAGTGTTLAVADCHGRDAIGIDIDERNRDMVDARMAEVRRALFGVKPELPGQVALPL